MSITKAMGCAAEKPEKRKASDFYPTPDECTVALLHQEASYIRPLGKVWEPAAGDGAIVRVLERFGFPVAASDLVDRGCSKALVENFFNITDPMGGAIVTNPPYGSGLPERFVRHAFKISIGYVALFLKANYWNAANRLRLWEDYPIAAHYPLTWRPDWTGGGSPTMDMAWYVWDASRPPLKGFRPLKKPVSDDIGQYCPSDLPLFGVAV